MGYEFGLKHMGYYHLCLDPSHKLAERLDRAHIQASLCRIYKLPQYPDVPYSPAIVALWNTFGLLQLLLFQHNHRIDLHNQIKASIASQSNFALPTMLEECKVRYNEALKNIKAAEKTKRQMGDKCKEHLTARAHHYSEHGDLTAEQCLKHLKQSKDQVQAKILCHFLQNGNEL